MDPTQNPHTQSKSTHKHYRKQNSRHTSRWRDSQRKTNQHTSHTHSTPYSVLPSKLPNGHTRWCHPQPPHIHRNHESEAAKNEFTYTDKWLSNNQINHKFSNHFWKAERVTNVQITQILTFRYAQYMGNHMKNIFWPSHTKIPIAHCTITMTHHTTYQHVKTHS